MRLCLVAHAFPPHERAGVENYTAALAAAFAARGHRVLVFAPYSVAELPDLSLRREERDGYEITWLNVLRTPADPAEALDPPGLADRFAAWLDVERPELVHLQHMVKLGLGFAERAAERGLPVVYTAHDYYPICHRFTLLRPDLARCETLGDPAVCARCDLALAVLNTIPALGDYHQGAFAKSLPAAKRSALTAVLAGDVERSGLHPNEWREAALRRAKLDRRRAAVYGGLDLILAPTEFLAERLRAGGLRKDRIVVLPYGIHTGHLARARAVERPRTPLRIGYVGSMTKHKGVHVLLEAFAGLERPAELLVFGDSTDRVFADAMRARTLALGGKWHGAFDARELAGVLERVDVLVVPSIWVENQPLAIREAFAAGVPVVASRVGALPESVRAGVDGLLFEPGDSADLRACLRRLLDESDLYQTLRAGLPEVKDASAQVVELEQLYTQARERAAGRRRPATTPLAHLVEVTRAHQELVDMPLSALFGRVLTGLERLGPLLGATQISSAELFQRAFGGASKTRETLRDMDTERDWLREQSVGLQRASAAKTKEASWRAQQLAEKARELEWLRERLAGAEKGLAARAEEAAWRARQVAEARAEVRSVGEEQAKLAAEKVRERAWLEERIEAAQKENRWLVEQQTADREKSAWLADQVDQLTREAEWLRETRAALEAERDSLREVSAGTGRERDWLRAEKAGLVRECDGLRGEQLVLAKERDWLHSEQAGLVRERDWLRGEQLVLAKERDWLHSEQAGLVRERDWLRGEQLVLAQERDWLRDEQVQVARERDWLREQLEGLGRENAWRRENQERLESAEVAAQAELTRAERELERLKALVIEREGGLVEAEARLADLDRLQRERIGHLERELAAVTERAAHFESHAERLLRRLEEGQGERPRERGENDGVAASELLEALLRELQWRRREMRAAEQELGATRARSLLLRTRLGRRAGNWRDRDGETKESKP